jgi:hypothetical protein
MIRVRRLNDENVSACRDGLQSSPSSDAPATVPSAKPLLAAKQNQIKPNKTKEKAWFSLAELSLFNGLQRIQIKKSFSVSGSAPIVTNGISSRLHRETAWPNDAGFPEAIRIAQAFRSLKKMT